jgi:hypothetical protein
LSRGGRRPPKSSHAKLFTSQGFKMSQLIDWLADEVIEGYEVRDSNRGTTFLTPSEQEEV